MSQNQSRAEGNQSAQNRKFSRSGSSNQQRHFSGNSSNKGGGATALSSSGRYSLIFFKLMKTRLSSMYKLRVRGLVWINIVNLGLMLFCLINTRKLGLCCFKFVWWIFFFSFVFENAVLRSIITMQKEGNLGQEQWVQIPILHPKLVLHRMVVINGSRTVVCDETPLPV